jgi:predicted PurR-regulated permease PerM
MESNILKIEPSKRSIIITAVVIFLLLAGDKIISVGVILFLAFILSSLILPVYRWLISKKVRKEIVLGGLTIGFVVLIVVIFSSIFLPFLLQLEKLIKETPDIVEKIAQMATNIEIPFVKLDEEAVKQSINEYVNSVSSDIIPNVLKGFEGAKATFTAIADVGGVLLTLVTIYAISTYFVVDHDLFVEKLISLFDAKKQKMIRKGLSKLEKRLNRWIVGEVFLMLVIGFMTWIFLTILGIPFALPLAVLAGFLEIIPNLGPIISSIPAILIALFEGGPTLAIGVAVGYIVIQQLENNLIVPKIMGNATGIHPLVILVGMLFGFSFGGILGALLTVPLLVLAKIAWEFWSEFRDLRK